MQDLRHKRQLQLLLFFFCYILIPRLGLHAGPVCTCLKKGYFSDVCFIDRGAPCFLNLCRAASFSLSIIVHVVLKQEQIYVFMIWFSPGVPLASKAINAFIYSKHDALRSMKQGSCIMND